MKAVIKKNFYFSTKFHDWFKEQGTKLAKDAYRRA